MSSDNSYGQYFDDILGADISYLQPHGCHFFRHQEPHRDGFLLYGTDTHLSGMVRSRTVSQSVHLAFID